MIDLHRPVRVARYGRSPVMGEAMKISTMGLSVEQRAWLEATFARNRARFGDLRMMADDGDSGGGQGDSGGGDDGDGGGGDDGPTLGPHGFPTGTPWRQMAPEHQAAYWRHQSRSTEDKLKAERAEATALREKAAQFDALDEASKTDAQREIDSLRAANEQLKADQARQVREFGQQLVTGRLAAVAPDKGLDVDAMTRIAGDLGRFLGEDGSLDEDSLTDFLALIPDRKSDAGQQEQQDQRQRNGLGGGRRGPAPSTSGADLYAQRHKKTTT